MHLKKPKALHFDEHRTHEGRARHKFNVYILIDVIIRSKQV